MRAIAMGMLTMVVAWTGAEARGFEAGPGAVPLLELFTSEGCSSCPPAEAWMSGRLNDPGLWRDFVPVAFHVNYWDRLGWPDKLATRAGTERQYAYARTWGAGGSVYTPGFVWAGCEWRPGLKKPRPAVSAPGCLRADIDNRGVVRIGFVPERGVVPREAALTACVAWLGVGVVSRVRAGENAGRELRHDFVVSRWLTVPMKASTDGWSAVVEPDETAPKGGEAKAIAVWVETLGVPVPLQAVGGWLSNLDASHCPQSVGSGPG